jgi:hypothetical protein
VSVSWQLPFFFFLVVSLFLSPSIVEPANREKTPQADPVLPLLPQTLGNLTYLAQIRMLYGIHSIRYVGPFHRMQILLFFFFRRTGPVGALTNAGWPSSAASPNARRSSSGFPLLTAADCQSPLVLIGHEGPQFPRLGRVPFPVLFGAFTAVRRSAALCNRFLNDDHCRRSTSFIGSEADI